MTNPLADLQRFVASVRAALAELDGAARALTLRTLTTEAGNHPVERGDLSAGPSPIPAREKNTEDFRELTSPRKAIPARVGRMVVVLEPGRTVLVLPLLQIADGPSAISPGAEAKGPAAYRELPLLALSRVPIAGECLLDGDGRTLHVLGVRHLPAGAVAAELHCEHLQLSALPAATEGAR